MQAPMCLSSSQAGMTTLSGSLRTYPTSGNPLVDPYGLSNFLYIGDDTKSAETQTNFTFVGFTAIPEPSFYVSLGIVGLLVATRKLW